MILTDRQHFPFFNRAASRMAEAIDKTAEAITASGCTMTMETGPWIAGGAVLAAITLDTSSDIDVFFRTVDDVNRVVRHFILQGYMDDGEESADSGGHHDDGGAPFSPGIVHTFTTPWGKVNIAALLLWPSAEELLGHFDITVAQVACAGDEVVLTEEAEEDITAKRLRTTCETGIHRVRKYIAKGYNLDTAEERAALAAGTGLPGKWALDRTLTTRLREVEAKRRERQAEPTDDLPW